MLNDNAFSFLLLIQHLISFPKLWAGGNHGYVGNNGNVAMTPRGSEGTGRAVGKPHQCQETDYYPFGLAIDRYLNGTKNDYLYNGKELQEELTVYDYGARFYDPVIARWTIIDPHSEKYASLSTYNYVYNNPLKHIDPDGKDGIVSIKTNTITISSYIYVYGSGATAANAKQMQDAIMKTWGSNNDKSWSYTDAGGNAYNAKFDVLCHCMMGNPRVIHL